MSEIQAKNTVKTNALEFLQFLIIIRYHEKKRTDEIKQFHMKTFLYLSLLCFNNLSNYIEFKDQATT